MASRMPAIDRHRRAEDEADRLDVRDVDARAPRGLGVAADGVDVPAEARSASSRNVSTTTSTATSGTTHGTPWMTIGAFARWRSWLSRNTATSTTHAERDDLGAHTDIAGVGRPGLACGVWIAQNVAPANPPMTMIANSQPRPTGMFLFMIVEDRVVADRDRPALADDQAASRPAGRGRTPASRRSSGSRAARPAARSRSRSPRR